MGIKERRDEEVKEMKKLIMDAAIKLIEKEGYEKLSIRKIAALIEYSPTTIYLYYKDKAEIITDISDELYKKVLEDVNSYTKKHTDLSVDQQLYEIFRLFIKRLCSEPEMVKTVMYSGMNEVFTDENSNDKPANLGIALLDNIIEDGIEQGVLNSNAAGTAWMIVSALLGFVMSAVGNRLYQNKEFDRSTDDFAMILINGVKHREDR